MAASSTWHESQVALLHPKLLVIRTVLINGSNPEPMVIRHPALDFKLLQSMIKDKFKED